MSTMRYSYWDILKAPRIALSGKNLLAQGRALLYGYVIYLILTYAALLIDGINWGYIWSNHYIFPFTNLDFQYWYSKLIWLVAIIQFGVWFYYGSLTVAKLAFEELKGNYFFPLKEAAREARTGLRILLVALIVPALLVVVLALLQAVYGLIALIPGVGEIIYAVSYGIPLFIWSLFVVFVAFGLATAFLTLPAIATINEKDSFGATFHIFNVIWTQPLRWVSLTAISLALAKVGTFVLGYFIIRSLQLTNFTAALFAGDKMRSIFATGYDMFTRRGAMLDFFCSLYPGSSIRFDWLSFAGFADADGSGYIAALIILGVLTLLALLIISYGLSIITCGQVIAFLLVRYHEDNEKLTEELVATEITPQSPPAEPPAEA